jgi:hypothetical protein
MILGLAAQAIVLMRLQRPFEESWWLAWNLAIWKPEGQVRLQPGVERSGAPGMLKTDLALKARWPVFARER